MAASNPGNRHTISHAQNLFWGDAQHDGSNSGLRGVQMTPIFQFEVAASDFTVADPNALVTKVALTTGTAAVTLVLATAVAGATAGTNVAHRDLRVPRNVQITTSDLTGGGTLTVVVKGKDQYGMDMWERILVTASDSTVSGNKAFKTITSIESVAATAGTSGTFYVGYGNKIGLPYKLDDRKDVLRITETSTGVTPATGVLVLPTYTATETHSATAKSAGATELPKDVRGTYLPIAATDVLANGLAIWYKVSDTSSKFGSFGLDQVAS